MLDPKLHVLNVMGTQFSRGVLGSTRGIKIARASCLPLTFLNVLKLNSAHNLKVLSVGRRIFTTKGKNSLNFHCYGKGKKVKNIKAETDTT